MDRFKKFSTAAWYAFRWLGVGVGVLATVFGAFQDITGGAGFWTLSPNDLVNVGLMLFVIFGAILLARHEYLFHAVAELYGNEHARSLWMDGIPPFRDQYLRYVRQGDYATVHRFWLAGHVNVTDAGDKTDLHIACEAGHPSIVRDLLERGGDPKRFSKNGMTPLMAAAQHGHLKVSGVLLEHDCAINACSTEDGCTALYTAASNGYPEFVEMLVREGAKLDIADHDNMTPLMAAMARSNWTIVRALMDAGANLERIDDAGATLMNYAEAFRAPEDIVSRLYENGLTASPGFERRGGGHAGTGKVRVKWERASADVH